MIDIQAEHLTVVKAIINKHLHGVSVLAFGSRVTGNAKEYSDLDLVLVGKTKLDSQLMSTLKDDFAESDLPFRVDLLDWHDLSDSFKEILTKEHEVILGSGLADYLPK